MCVSSQSSCTQYCVHNTCASVASPPVPQYCIRNTCASVASPPVPQYCIHNTSASVANHVPQYCIHNTSGVSSKSYTPILYSQYKSAVSPVPQYCIHNTSASVLPVLYPNNVFTIQVSSQSCRLYPNIVFTIQVSSQSCTPILYSQYKSAVSPVPRYFIHNTSASAANNVFTI